MILRSHGGRPRGPAVLLGLIAAATLALPAALPAQVGPAIKRARRPAVKKIVPGKRQRQAKRGPARGGGIDDFVQRMMRVPADRRRRMLDENQRFRRLPAAQRQRIEDRLKRFDALPQDRRELLVQRYQLFSRLGPDRQTQARTLYRSWSKLPRQRRSRVSSAVQRLRRAPPAARESTMASERFKEMFDADERSMIGQILELHPADGSSGQGPR